MAAVGVFSGLAKCLHIRELVTSEQVTSLDESTLQDREQTFRLRLSVYAYDSLHAHRLQRTPTHSDGQTDAFATRLSRELLMLAAPICRHAPVQTPSRVSVAPESGRRATERDAQ